MLSNITDYLSGRSEVENVHEGIVRIPSPLPISFPWVEDNSHEQVIMSMNNSNFNEKSKHIIEEQEPFNSSSSEPLHRERKRWVRPLLANEASVGNTPVIVKGATCLETITVGESEDEDQTSNRCVNDVHLQLDKTNTVTSNIEIDDLKEQSEFYKAMRKHVGNYQASTVFRDDVDIHSRTFTNREDYLSGRVIVSEASLLADMNMAPVSCETMQENGARAPSPSSVSSVTSGRRLEWDSGADVGYRDIYSGAGPRLSTIERIALERGCSTAMFMRLTPEGKSVPMKQSTNKKFMLRPPIAESTPVDNIVDQDKAPCTSTATESEGEITPIVRQANLLLLLATGQHSQPHFHSSKSEHDNEQLIYKGNIGKLLPQKNVSNLPLKKFSSSLTDLSMCSDNIKNSNRLLPRSHSHLNILDQQEDYKQESNQLPRNVLISSQVATCSVSSSSIATVVPKQEPNKVFNKRIQTISHTPIKLSVGVQASRFPYKSSKPINEMSSICGEGKHSLSSPIKSKEKDILTGQTEYSKYSVCSSNDSNNKLNGSQSQSTLSQLNQLYSKLEHNQLGNTICQDNKCTGAHRKGVCTRDDDLSNNRAPSFSRNRALKIRQIKSQGAQREIERESSQHENRAEEFSTLESIASSTQTAGSWYVAETPLYGTGTQHCGSAGVVGSAHSFEYLPGHVYESNGAVGIENGVEDFSSSHSFQVETKQTSQSNEMSDKMSSSSSTLERELVHGVKLLEELVRRKTYDSNMKKQLIRHVINRLESGCKEDDVSDIHNTPLESNVPWIPADQRVARERLGSISSTCFQPIPVAAFSRSKVAMSKEVPTASSETTITSSSCVASLPTHNGDSRVETTTETSSVTMPNHQGKIQRTSAINSEQELKYLKQKQEDKHTQQHKGNETTLLEFCKTERENQLYWIRFEIDHLKNLKQLLEKQEGLKRSLANLAAHEHKFLQSRPATTPGREWHNSPETRSSSTSLSDDKLRNLQPQRSVASKSSDSPDVPNWASNNFAFSKTEDSDGQYITKHKQQNKCASEKMGSRQQCSKQTHMLESVQRTGTADSALGSILDGSGKNGKINVYVQTMNQQFLRPNEESSSKCCCECRRILKGIVESRNTLINKCKNKSPIEIDKNICSKCQISNSTYNGHKHISVNQIPQKNSISDLCVVSNETSRTSGNVVEISTDSKDQSSNKITGNVGVQTTPPLMDIKTLWHSRNIQQIPNQKFNTLNKAVNVPSESDIVCPCCGLLEEKESKAKLPKAHTDIIKCCNCNMTGNVVEAAAAEKQPTETSLAYKFANSNNKPDLTEFCHCCEGSKVLIKKKQQGAEYVNQGLTTSLSVIQPKLSQKSMAYILTFEQKTDENVLENEERRKSLPEITLKIPFPANVCKRQKHKVQVESEASLSSQKTTLSSKENESPQENRNGNRTKSSEDDITIRPKKTHKLTLQEYLKVNRPDYVQCADKRQQCIADLAYLRELRHEGRQRLLTMTGEPHRQLSTTSSSTSRNKQPLSERQVFTQRRMHEQTERKYRRLAEVQNKKAELKKKENFRTNRLMAEIYTKKLQKRVLKGEVNFSNSVSVISNL